MPLATSDAEREAIELANSSAGLDDDTGAIDFSTIWGEAYAEELVAKVAKSDRGKILKLRARSRELALKKDVAALRANCRAMDQLLQKLLPKNSEPYSGEPDENLAATAAGALLELGRIKLARSALLDLSVPDIDGPRRQQTESELQGLQMALGDSLKTLRDWHAGSDNALAEVDLGLVCNVNMLASVGRRQGGMAGSIALVFKIAARQARMAGLTVGLIPDYIFYASPSRPKNILSFHSAGDFPGFMHFKRADLPAFIVLDRTGYSGWSSLSGRSLSDLDLPPLASARNSHARLWKRIVERNLSKYDQPGRGELGTELPESFVFVALQVPNDRTQLMARFNMEEMLKIVIKRFRGTSTTVVVKPHPKTRDDALMERLYALNDAGEIFICHDSIHDLISKCQAVITVNSGVGSEALLHGKPIYCFGAADYDPVAHRIHSEQEFHLATDPIRPAVEAEDLMRFNAYYRETYLVDTTVEGNLAKAIRERVIDPILAEKSGRQGDPIRR